MGLILFISLAFTVNCNELLEETDVRVASQIPEPGACGVLPAEIVVRFSTSMESSSLSSITSGSACTGSIQVSPDNFVTCIPFQTATPVSDDSKVFRLTPTAALDAGKNYKIRVSTEAKSSKGEALSNAYESAAGFGSQAQILITEVGMCRYTNRSCWFEIYNKSSQCKANLKDYTIRSTYVDSVAGGKNTTTENFTLPELELSGGAYLVVRGQTANGGEYINGPGQIYISNAASPPPPTDKAPWWDTWGAIEIVKGGATIDFIRFGTSGITPTSGTWTDGTLPAMWASADTNYGKSIARDANLTDTDKGDDWTAKDFATPGAPNDVLCSTDADQDGIPDCSEVAGSTFAGLNLYAMGARQGQKDVFIEVDYMDSTDPGVTPRREALDKVKQVFAGRGYKVHFDVGSLYHPGDGISEADHDLGNASAKVPFSQGIELGASGNKTNFYTYKAAHMDIRRRNIFYYALFSYSRNADGSAGSSGLQKSTVTT